jgi:hypothetical protein
MHEALIVCGGLEPPRSQGDDLIELDVSRDAPAARRIDFDTTKLCAPLVDDLPDVLADALELAAYVFCADRLVKRGGSKAGRGIGSEWQRHLRFRIPVRCSAVWQRADVHSTLVATLSFLSGDRFSFEFHASRRPVSLEPHLGFSDSNAQTIRPDLLLLFSGGLDSLAGVARDVIGAGRKAILVTHHSANAIIDLQHRLANEIEARTPPGTVFYLPVRLRRGQDQPCEHSQRLRSFLFATLGMAYARMFGLDTVTFYENGITSFNLPIAEHVLGTRASRTTHPKVLASYGRLFSLLLGEPVSVVNPFLWQTKTDIVRTVASHGCADLIGLTTSCASVRDYSMTRRQCGVCSQCVERRMAMLAAGIDEKEAYATDMLLGPVTAPTALTMIGGHLLRARRLSTMSRHAFLSNHGQAFRALGEIGPSVAEAAERTFLLHQRYGTEFVAAVEQALGQHATIDGMRAIHSSSLLDMLLKRPAQERPFLDPTEQAASASDQAASAPPVRAGTIVLAIDHSRKRVIFSDGPILTSNHYRIVSALNEHRQAQIDNGMQLPNCSYLATRRLMESVVMEEDTLRTNVSRLRSKLNREFEAHTGYRLDQQDVIQSSEWQGYRLNPYVMVVAPQNLVQRPQTSRKSRATVTPPAVTA